MTQTSLRPIDLLEDGLRNVYQLDVHRVKIDTSYYLVMDATGWIEKLMGGMTGDAGTKCKLYAELDAVVKSYFPRYDHRRTLPHNSMHILRQAGVSPFEPPFVYRIYWIY